MKPYFYPEHESKFLEFKSKLPPFATLIKTSIAFANAAGGQIIIGVEDSNREIIGVSKHDKKRIYNDFQNSLYDSTQPNLYAHIYEKNYNDESILIIDIPAGLRKPYFIKSEGMRKGTYIRVGSSTRKASEEYITDLSREASRINYDEEPVNADAGILSKELLKAYYQKPVTKKRLMVDRLISNQYANREKICPTITGVLMFNEEPQLFIPESIIICTRFRGDEGRNIIFTEEITGSVPEQIEDSLQLVKSWLMRDYELKGAKLVGQMPIPLKALRESIINAVLHRKYSIHGAVRVSIYDNRLEVFSPGCLPGLIDINYLGDGTTYLRNPNLARIARKMNIIEKQGTGIKLIFDQCKDAKIKKPEYREDGDFVKLIFYFSPDVSNDQDLEVVLLDMIKRNGYVTANDVMNICDVSRNTATRRLNQLIKKKKIKRVGHARGVKYLSDG